MTWVRGQEGMNKQKIGDFKGVETMLYDTIMVDTCHYTFVKAHRIYKTKSESYGKLDFGLLWCQHMFHSWNKCTTLVGGVGSGGDNTCVRAGVYGNSP